MPETSTSARYKAEMPEIPGLAAPPPRHRNPLFPLIIGMIGLGVVLLLALRFISHSGKSEPSRVEPPPQIEVPSPPPDPNALLPHADAGNPAIADLAALSKPWSSTDFFIRNGLSGESIPATVIRLPGGSATTASGYWAFSRKAAFGDCQLEYITDLDKIVKEYEFRHATHPLVGNPCSRTLYDPLKTANLPGNIWIRGAIVQGSDVRPPLGVEIKIQGKQLLAIRTE